MYCFVSRNVLIVLFICHGCQRINFIIVLSVLVPPVLLTAPQDKTVPQGTPSVRFICQVESDPRPSFRWLKDREVLTEGAKYTVHVDGTLVVRDITARDAGTYECLAQNAAGTIRAFVTLSVGAGRVVTTL